MLKDILRGKTDQLEVLCQANLVRSLEVFGSVTTERFNSSSDVDFLVSFFESLPARRAEAYFNLWFGLEDLLGRRVDLVVRDAIWNPYFQRELTRTSFVLFDAQSKAIHAR
jgi:uncharacterized protein